MLSKPNAGSIASAKLPRTRKQLAHIRRLSRMPKNLSGLKRYHRVYHPPTKRQLDALERGRKTCIGLSSKIELWFFRRLKRKIKGLLSNNMVSTCGHNYFPDISNPRTNRIVEIDGTNWHVDKIRKRRRDRALRRAGWKILHLQARRKYLKKIEENVVKFLRGVE